MKRIRFKHEGTKVTKRLSTISNFFVIFVSSWFINSAALAGDLVPPPMPKRAISKPATQPAGQQIEILDQDAKFVLFVPQSYKPSDAVNLTVHFHGAVWFCIDEHLRRGLNEPLLVFYPGEGSSIYQKFFKDENRLDRAMNLVVEELKRQGAPASTHIARLDITSFSAGYGAVREIVKQDRYLALIRRIILCDSLYSGWDPATTQPGATSKPARENMEPWEKVVKLAADGKLTLVLTHSMVPTSYANSDACGRALCEIAGIERHEVAKGSIPATLEPEFPLLFRADKNGFHVWSYGGIDAQAHMTHVRHLADVWKALDDAGR